MSNNYEYIYGRKAYGTHSENIARGTTDPGYWLFNLSYLSSLIEWHLHWFQIGQLYVVPLVSFQNLTTRWRHQHWFQIWPPGGATCISYKFGHQMAPLASVAISTNSWHHWYSILWWGNFDNIWHTCIAFQFAHHLASLALVANFTNFNTTLTTCIGHQDA